MSRILRSRIVPYLSTKAKSRRSLSSFTQNPTPTPPPPPSSFTTSADPLKEPVNSADPIPREQSFPKKSYGLLKFGAFAAVTGAIGATAYVTKAYTLDEVNQITSHLRAKSNYSVDADASGFEKFKALMYSSAIKVPIKTIELYMDIRKSIEEQVQGFTEPSSEKLLPDMSPEEQQHQIFTLVLDLNETLVYSDWKRERGWRTFKRPGVDAFLEHMAKFYEIVIYTDQLSVYVDPVIERLDQKGCIRYKLSRAATRYVDGKHYRDLSKLNRDPSRVIYISGHALESVFQPENSVPIKPWKLENEDTVLLDLIPFLEYVAVMKPADIRPVLASFQGHDIATEFIERAKEHQRRAQQQKKPSLWRR